MPCQILSRVVTINICIDLSTGNGSTAGETTTEYYIILDEERWWLFVLEKEEKGRSSASNPPLGVRVGVPKNFLLHFVLRMQEENVKGKYCARIKGALLRGC